MNKKKNVLSKKQIEDAFNLFYENCTSIPHSRYKSWEHCKIVFNKFFEDIKNNKYTAETIPFEIADNLCLNLGFYLASWGMMRGSTDLLQRDFKIHAKAIPVLLKYYELNDLDIINLKDNYYLNKIMELRKEIRKAYLKDSQNPLSDMSDTLETKIMMGTLGIVPAYDDFVKDALKYYDFCGASGLFTTNSLKNLATYFTQKEIDGLIIELQKKMNTNSSTLVFYPKTKIVDMILWELGAKLQKK